MKFKLFVVEENHKLLEQQVNDWLENNKNIIIHAHNYQIRESYNPKKEHVNSIHACTIWYDGPEYTNTDTRADLEKFIKDVQQRVEKLSVTALEVVESKKPTKPRRLEKLYESV